MSRALTVERNCTQYAYLDIEDDDLQDMHDDGVDLDKGQEVLEWLRKHNATDDLDWDTEYDDGDNIYANYWEGHGNFTPAPKEHKPRPIKPITGQLTIDGTEVQ